MATAGSYPGPRKTVRAGRSRAEIEDDGRAFWPALRARSPAIPRVLPPARRESNAKNRFSRRGAGTQRRTIRTKTASCRQARVSGDASILPHSLLFPSAALRLCARIFRSRGPCRPAYPPKSFPPVSAQGCTPPRHLPHSPAFSRLGDQGGSRFGCPLGDAGPERMSPQLPHCPITQLPDRGTLPSCRILSSSPLRLCASARESSVLVDPAGPHPRRSASRLSQHRGAPHPAVSHILPRSPACAREIVGVGPSRSPEGGVTVGSLPASSRAPIGPGPAPLVVNFLRFPRRCGRVFPPWKSHSVLSGSSGFPGSGRWIVTLVGQNYVRVPASGLGAGRRH
jgi:hypothetical protein